jgi:biopolymer transport protein ExbD
MSEVSTQPDDLTPAAEQLDETVHHVSARKKRKKDGGVGELQLTSMIDVIFQLLIYFVVTASFAIDEGILAAKLPQGSGSAAETEELPKEKITIELTSGPGDTTVLISRSGVRNYATFSELAADLDQLRYDPDIGQINGIYKHDDPVIIEPTGFVRWQHVVSAFNAAIAAKYSNVSFGEAKQ